jgi:response regulator RpfG family c-di-GMP phosphodiesterase
VEEIRRQSGRQFDPTLVGGFLRVIQRTPVSQQIG